MNFVKIASRILMAFVLVSVGYALGRHTASRYADPSTAPAAPPAGEHLVVYYMHRTVRCESCNTMERATRRVLETNFAEQLRAGRIELRLVDFQENEPLARKYNVSTSTVVLVRFVDGVEKASRNLDDVWEFLRDAPAMERYIRDAVAGMLTAEGRL